jgi:autophagy-related protein 2
MCLFFHKVGLSDGLTPSLASVDEYAFKRIPEVGPAPDMINDDLPTNLDYLDESFGTAAGLRELRDDDLDDFNTEDDVPPLTPELGAHQTGVISRVGGETIKILRPEGIHIIEHYFDTLPPDLGPENSE